MSTDFFHSTADYGPLVDTCAAWGIRRNAAFELARRGLIDTFQIGRKRFVRIQSLRTLPDRLSQPDAAA
jgi:hypothetical protein